MQQDSAAVRSRVLIITTMNELQGVRSIWDKIPFELFGRVIVVDNHSTDGTIEFLADKRSEIWTQKTPGRGNAIREVMEQISEEIIVLFASDGNDDPRYIPALLAKIDEGYDLVTGSRFLEGGATDDSDDPYGTRRFGNRVLTFLVNFFWNAHLTDSTYGMRAFRMGAWKKMKIDAKLNETEFMMSIRATKLGLKLVQIPVVEGNRVGGEVKARSLSTGWSHLKLVFAELLKGNSF